MSYTATFDTLEFAKTLQAEGFQTKQAEGLSKALRQAFQSADNGRQEELKAIEAKLQDELKSSRNELATKGDVLALKGDIFAIKGDLAALEARLIKWNVATIIAAAGIGIALASLFR